MDFYFVICNSLFDKYSYENNYKAEITLINKLWESTNNGNNYENSILYLYIAEYALKTENNLYRKKSEIEMLTT